MKASTSIRVLGLAFVVMIAGGWSDARAAIVLASWDATGHASNTALPVDFTLDGVTASSISFGGGLTPSASIDNSIAAAAWTTGGVPNSNDYFAFSITVAGDPVSLSTLDFAERRVNVNAPQGFEIRASTSETFTTYITVATGALSGITAVDYSVDLTAFEMFEEFSGTVYFRIAGFSAVNGAGVWSLTNNSDVGSIRITAVPEPGVMSLVAGGLGLAVVGMYLRKRRVF